MFWILNIGDSCMKVWNNWLYSQASQNPWIFSQNSPGMIELKKQLFSQKGIALKICFLSFHFPSTSISKYYLADMHNSLICLVWSFLLVVSCGSKGKKAGTANKYCLTSVYILYPGWHKQPSKMRVSCSQVQTTKSAETLKWVSSSLHESCAFTFLFCRRMKTAAKLQRCNAFYRISQKDSGEWLFWVMNKTQWPFTFNWWNPSAHICCFRPWECKISNQTSSFGPEVLILFFSNFFVK